MAKKKKKHKPQKSNSALKKIRYIEFEKDEILMTPFLMYNDGEYDTENIAKSCIGLEYENLIAKKPEFKYTAKYAIEKTKEQFVKTINTITDLYLTTHECDDGLNFENEDSIINTKADILDFTSFENPDILKATMFQLVNKDLHPEDISLLWSTNEYVRIIISPSLEYGMKRLGYDEINNAVKYEMVCFEKRIFFENGIIKIPSLICQISVGIKEAQNITIDETDDKDESGTINHNKMAMQWSTMYNLEKIVTGNPDRYFYPIYSIEKANSIAHYEQCFKKAMKNIMNITDVKLKSLLERTVKMICARISVGDDEFSSTACMNYARQKISVGIASIILTNLMLQSEKLSAPKEKTPHTVIYENKTDNNNSKTVQPSVRKTRNLGLIRITSEKRPSTPTMNKIIRFTKAEWSRQGFVRHYKSGKTIFVKPTTVRRRCIDISNAKTDNQTKSTKYVLHSDKIDNSDS